MSMHPHARIFVAGHAGLAGSALVRQLQSDGFHNLLLRTRAHLDLRCAASVTRFFETERPEFVFLAAAKVGGIALNLNHPADFIIENLQLQTNVITASQNFGVTRLLFFASSAVYPSRCAQPIKEEALLTGALEPSNRPYSIAKLAGIEMCRSCNAQYGSKFLSAMVTNLYGPGDQYQGERAHFLPALVRRVMEAKRDGKDEVVVWGTGTPRRELLYSDDLARACIQLMSLPDSDFDSLLTNDPPIVNIGAGSDMAIRDIAETVCKVLGYRGRLVFDTSKPDGTMRKLLDCSRLREILQWSPQILLEQGIANCAEDFSERLNSQRSA